MHSSLERASRTQSQQWRGFFVVVPCEGGDGETQDWSTPIVAQTIKEG